MKREDISFKIGDETLRGTLFIPIGKGPFPGVVFYHGRGSTRARYLPMAESLAKEGVMALAFDFRGCGESEGEFENQTHRMGVEDAIAGFKFLLNQNIDKNRIGIQGTSFGGYVTGMLLNDYDFIKSVVLRVPASYSDSNLEHKGDEVGGYFQNRENWIDSSAYRGIGKFKGSLLVIKSEFDEVISAEAVDKYYKDAVNAQKREQIIHKRAKHNLSDNPKGLAEFYKITIEWFLKTL